MMKSGFKKTLRGWTTTRIETWAMPGVRKIATKTKPQSFYLYHGSLAMDLKMEGLKVPPVYWTDGDIDWEKVMSLISPT